MVPHAEVLVLRGLTLQAIDMALDGNAGDGYVHLVRGMHRVKEKGDPEAAWREELIGRYKHALDEFADLYRIARE